MNDIYDLDYKRPIGCDAFNTQVNNNNNDGPSKHTFLA